jgi:hypothetical protein
VCGIWDVTALDLNRINRELMTCAASAWARELSTPHGPLRQPGT